MVQPPFFRGELLNFRGVVDEWSITHVQAIVMQIWTYPRPRKWGPIGRPNLIILPFLTGYSPFPRWCLACIGVVSNEFPWNMRQSWLKPELILDIQSQLLRFGIWTSKIYRKKHRSPEVFAWMSRVSCKFRGKKIPILISLLFEEIQQPKMLSQMLPKKL